ncbi:MULTISPECIES: hypothetical protein [unclassified Streptomyces]|uniref:hypothetical protein n=1 Tax=unclassified Streptomyces TaxID=2593676 RepID=UPI00081F5CE4|nr:MULTISPECIES: hypothetical protein [unclassified Streptomyces]MYZ36469.1 hypothetical protein [Streptomyces sp. SID4917]SCF83795.1 hypothetical protein GA0115259_1034126 [Streptomyces sp. MnatMP-M17]
MSHRGGSERLNGLLASAYKQLGVVVHDTLTAQGGPPELRDPDLALDRLLASAHRQSKAAVLARIAQQREELRAVRQRAESALAGTAEEGAALLMRRPVDVRLKFRTQALELTRIYWPQDLAALILDSLERVQELICSLEESESPPSGFPRMLELASTRLNPVLRLPTAQSAPPVAADDYPMAVRNSLSAHADRVLHAARSAQRLADLELGGYLSEPETFWLAALEVSHDLADDLDLARREAIMLSSTVTAVRKASNDFRGADLRSVDLRGLSLQGITWDAATNWPEEWEERIRRASQIADEDHGVLIVGIEPHDVTVHADI